MHAYMCHNHNDPSSMLTLGLASGLLLANGVAPRDTYDASTFVLRVTRDDGALSVALATVSFGEACEVDVMEFEVFRRKYFSIPLNLRPHFCNGDTNGTETLQLK